MESLFGLIKDTSAVVNNVSSSVTTVNTNVLRGVVKSVQRGTLRPEDGSLVTIASVNASKCQVVINGMSYYNSTSSGSFTGFPYLLSLSGTQLSIGSGGYNYSNHGVILSWQVIEFY